MSQFYIFILLEIDNKLLGVPVNFDPLENHQITRFFILVPILISLNCGINFNYLLI